MDAGQGFIAGSIDFMVALFVFLMGLGVLVVLIVYIFEPFL